jgi:arsenical pump membrane protein
MHAVWCTAALDMTGCFQWVALHLTRMSKGNGLALFLLYYTLSSVLTIFTSNDVSIMALTVSDSPL